MKKLSFITLMSLTLVSLNVNAHKDHGAVYQKIEITQEQAIVIATKAVNEKIKLGELELSWNSIDSKTAVLERINGRQTWKITLTKLSNTKTEIVNVFLTKTGSFISLIK